MLYREALLELGPIAASYVGEASRVGSGRVSVEEILGCMRCTSATGRRAPAAMALANDQGAYGVAYLQALIAPPDPAREVITLAGSPSTGLQPLLLVLADLPPQAEVDRALSTYESYVRSPTARRTGVWPWRRWARCGHDRRPPGPAHRPLRRSAARAPGVAPCGGRLAELARSRRGLWSERQRLPARPARRGGRRPRQRGDPATAT